jgi:hypothetical protein
MTTSIIEKEIGSKIMLYDPERDEIHILNPTARLIYTLSKGGKNLEEIAQAIRGTFKLQENQNLEESIQECLAELKDKGLVP